MTKKKSQTEDTAEETKKAKTTEAQTEAQAESQTEGEAEDRAAKKVIADLEKELAQAKQTLSETEDRLLRTLAEYDNFKKRTVREKEELSFLSRSEMIRLLLPVFDNFDRAQKFTDAEDYKAGVDMIITQFFQILESIGVTEIAKEGDPFDPNFHEAVFREEKEGVEEGRITEVLQKGYAVGDKVIRHAMVKVSG